MALQFERLFLCQIGAEFSAIGLGMSHLVVETTIGLGISHLVVKTDAQQVVWPLQGNDHRLSMLGGLMHELKEILAKNFAASQVLFASRMQSRSA